MAPFYTLLIATILIITVDVKADYKQWIHSTNFEDPKNWNVGRLPCSADHVSFPENSPAVYVQINTTLTELVLPTNGELIFGKWASIGATLPGSRDPGCPGDAVVYVGDKPRSWYDPDNWCTTYDAEGQCVATQPEVLESERVPCKTEGIAFPADKTFLVDLDTGVDIEIMSLRMGTTEYDTGSFRRFMDSDEGKKQFVRADGRTETTVNIRKVPCTDNTGCMCGNDEGPIFDHICEKYKVNGTCPDVKCSGALSPYGGCCKRCGGLFELGYSHPNYRKDSFESMIRSRYLRDNPTVHSIVSKTMYDMIQVLLFDNEGGDAAVDVGKQLQNYLNGDGGDQYGITDVKLDVSEPSNPTAKPHTGGAMSAGSVTGLILGLLILLGVLGLAMFCFTYYRTNNRVPRPNVNLPSTASLKRNLPNTASLKRTLSRLGRSGKNGDLELGPSVAFKDGAVNYADLGGFDNPMYGNLGDVKMSAMEGAEAQPVTLVAGGGTSRDDGSGFTNPMYGQPPPQVAAGRRSERYDSCDITDFPDMSVEGLVNPLYGADLGGPTQINNRSSSPFHHHIDSDYKSGGFSNPLYGQAPGTQEVSHAKDGSSFLHLNPVFSTEGVEEDSEI